MTKICSNTAHKVGSITVWNTCCNCGFCPRKKFIEDAKAAVKPTGNETIDRINRRVAGVHAALAYTLDPPITRRIITMLRKRAERAFKQQVISPASNDTRTLSWAECVTKQGDEFVLWFNTPDRSAHMIKMPIK